ncbi:zinc finger BED domain-containing protein RICESLEEPER 2 [Tanacetum coccineum]
MKEKLKKYFQRMPLVITYAAALNACFNVSAVELLIETISTDLELFDDGHTTKPKEWFNQSLKGLYNIYYMKYGNLTSQPTSGASSLRTSSESPMTNLFYKLKEKSNKLAKNDRSLTFEYERYVNTNFISHLEPTEFAATSVASESAFSTSEKVLSIRRTKLTLMSLEMCMCLKDHLDTQERVQHTSTLENALDFEEEILDAEV